MATTKVGVSSLLAFAFSASLDSPVITYDQYKKLELEKEKEEEYYEELDINRLFNLSHITGCFGTEKAEEKAVPHMDIYMSKR